MHVAMNGIGLVSVIIFGKILVQVNPHRRGIVGLINILNRMGANFKLIAACLNLQRWNNYYGIDGWTEEDVKGILGVLRS